MRTDFYRRTLQQGILSCVALSLFVTGSGTIDAEEHGGSRPGGPRSTKECDPATCRVPACNCPSPTPPENMAPSQTPQVILITFDDAIHHKNIEYFETIFNPKYKNPNGCSIGGTFFVSDAADGFGLESDYSLVKKVYDMGMEIAVHSLSHTYPETWWSRNATYGEYVEQMVGQRKKISTLAGIPETDLVGVRTPFMSIGGDNMYKALYDNNFVYDKSMLTGAPHYDEEQFKPLFPYTLDFPPKRGTVCDNGRVDSTNCPLGSYPGFWAVPVNRPFRKGKKTSCNGADSLGCDFDAGEDIFEFFVYNFDLHYKNNRAPLCLLLHASWFISQPEGVGFIQQFIEYVSRYEDVYIVTVHELVQWMKQPTDTTKIRLFPPWRKRCKESEEEHGSSAIFSEQSVGYYGQVLGLSVIILVLVFILSGRRWLCRSLLKMTSFQKPADDRPGRV